MTQEQARDSILAGMSFADVYPHLDGASPDPDRPSPGQLMLKEWFVREPAAPRYPKRVNGHKPPGTLPIPAAEEHRKARALGFIGDPCPKCGNLTLRPNGPCFVCLTCNETTGCS